MRRLPRRVRLALRRPSARRQWRIPTEARLVEHLSHPDMRRLMERIWLDLAAYGTSVSVLTQQGWEDMRYALATPTREWLTLRQTEG